MKFTLVKPTEARGRLQILALALRERINPLRAEDSHMRLPQPPQSHE